MYRELTACLDNVPDHTDEEIFKKYPAEDRSNI